MATSIELEDYDLKKNKVYLAISQSIDTVNFEQKKVCLVGDDNRCLYQEERKFCSQTFFCFTTYPPIVQKAKPGNSKVLAMAIQTN